MRSAAKPIIVVTLEMIKIYEQNLSQKHPISAHGKELLGMKYFQCHVDNLFSWRQSPQSLCWVMTYEFTTSPITMWVSHVIQMVPPDIIQESKKPFPRQLCKVMHCWWGSSRNFGIRHQPEAKLVVLIARWARAAKSICPQGPISNYGFMNVQILCSFQPFTDNVQASVK